MKSNYHTHTTRCQHAEGQDEEYVLSALAAGFDDLGFSDHAPWPFASGYVSDIRMPMSDLAGYIASIRALKDKYADQLPIHLGLESEFFPRYRDHMLRLRDRGINYLILGQHYADSEEDHGYVGQECRTDDGVRRYAEVTVNAMRTGMFAYLAHPDLFMRHRTADQFTPACEEAADMLCQAALETHMPLEYNLLGLSSELSGAPRGYPSAPFWAYIQKYRCPVILGVDAHAPSMLADTALWGEGRRRVEAMAFPIVEQLTIEED